MALGRMLTIARATAPSVFAAVCVTEQRSLEINNEEVDITKPNCASPGSKLVAAFQYGVQTMRISGAGAFVNAASYKALAADAVNQVVSNYQITVPDVGTFTGDGLVSMSFSGDKSNELQADFKLSLTGTVTFVAAV